MAHFLKKKQRGRGGAQVVSMLALYSDDPTSNPAGVYNFPVNLLLKRIKINEKEGIGHLKNISSNCPGGSVTRLDKRLLFWPNFKSIWYI